MSTTEADDIQPQQQQPQHHQAWTTWDELILAFAVKRHGCRNWDSVSNELQTRTKLLHTSPDSCRLKFHDLRRRFRQSSAAADDDVDVEDDEDVDLTVPWVEDLRRLRLDELRAEVNRHDLAIESLQSKVKRLETDREQSVKDEGEEEKPSDLSRSDNNHPETEPSPSLSNPRAVADDNDESDPENQSVNGSNSTGPNKPKEHGSGQNEFEPETQTGLDEKIEPVIPGSKRNESSSTNQDESSDSIDKELSIETQKKKGGDEGGGGGGAKTDSDVQSSATLSRKRQPKKESPGRSGEADGRLRTEESGPLINLLSLVRSHKDASFFERRLQIQESEVYNNVVRQHMDFQIIQNNLESGSYTSSHLMFFRDLILTFTNAMIFHLKSSPEYKAAQELRSLVSEKLDEYFKQSQRSEEKLLSAPHSPRSKHLLERSDSLLAKHKPSGSGPIVVCRKRSSISAKGYSSSKGEQNQSDAGAEMKTVALADLKLSPMEERGLLSSKTKDRIVTGTRSMRRSNTSLKKHTTLPTATATATTSKETPVATTTTSTEKKKEESTASKKDDISAKKKGAADFLKRLKSNSPVKAKDVKNSGTAGGEKKKKNGNGDKVDRRRKIATRQTDSIKQSSKAEGGSSPTKRNVGRPSKKTPESATTVVKRSRDNEASGSASLTSKQPKKRTRR